MDRPKDDTHEGRGADTGGETGPSKAGVAGCKIEKGREAELIGSERGGSRRTDVCNKRGPWPPFHPGRGTRTANWMG